MIPDSKLTWFSFNPSEFLTRTVGLPNRDVGAYIKLLSYSWVNGPIPNDARVLASIAGKADMALITARFFEVDEEGKLCDPRLEASRMEAAKLLEANRKRTAKAGENRWKSPSPSLDASVTETEDNDRTKREQDNKSTGQLEGKTRQVNEKTSSHLDVGSTLHENHSVTLVENPSPDRPDRRREFPQIPSIQSIQPDGSGQSRQAPDNTSAKRSPELQAAIDRHRAIQQKSIDPAPEWEAA
jgi:uncharacterized protein YdaU (DUF1376 family)